jgi:hypothetical protein
MSADVLRLMREADPATTMPSDDPDRCEDLRRSIVSSADASDVDPDRLAPRSHTRRRVAILLVAAAVVVTSACATVVATQLLQPSPAHFGQTPAAPAPDALMTLRQVRAQFGVWKGKLSLPPGAAWDRIVVPKRMRHDTWSGNSGVMLAFDQAIGKWCEEWIAAAKVNDRARAAAAAGALTRLSAIMPVRTEGMMENQAGFEQWVVDELKAAISDGEAGRLDGIRGLVDLANAHL